MRRVKRVVKLQNIPRTDYLYVIGGQYFILYCIVSYGIISYGMGGAKKSHHH